MVYGIKITDLDGSVTDSGVNLARLIAVVSFTGTGTTTQTVNNFDSTKGFYFITLDSPPGIIPSYTFDNSAKVLTIVPDGSAGKILLIHKA